jgi:2-amino-4-hydroxy-6-hydroxymethyldihydropteridine diphosphokinase
VTVAIVGLGGNLGDTRGLMAAALRLLAQHPDIEVTAVSPLYETPPWGKTDQPAFRNAAARLDTRLSCRALLEAILQVETELGRERGERWGPRTVDIDILLFGDETVDEPGLHVPHPRLGERAFALQPLVDVAPDASFAGRRAADWLAEADRSGLMRLAGREWASLERSAPGSRAFGSQG